MNNLPNVILRSFIKDTAAMTQSEFAAAMDFGKGYISLVLNGHKPISEQFLWRFYDRFVEKDAPFYLPEASKILRMISHGTVKVVE